MDNELSQFMAEERKQKQAGQALVNVDLHRDMNPDTAAKALPIAKKLNVPMEEVAQDVTRYGMQAKNLSDYMKKHSYTAQFLADPEKAAISHDDIENVGAIEEFVADWARLNVTVPQQFTASFIGDGGAGTALSGAGRLYNIYSRGVNEAFDYVMPKSVVDAKNKPLFSADIDRELMRWVDPGVIASNAGQAFKQIGHAIEPEEEYQNLVTDIAGGLGGLGFQAGTAFLTGGTSAVGVMFAQGADIMGEKTEGDNATQLEKDLAVLSGAGITAVTEKFGLNKLLERIPPKIRSRTVQYIADIAIAGGIEAAQEAVEGIMHDVARVVLTNPDAKIGEGLGYEALVGGGTGASARVIVQALTKKNRSVDTPPRVKEKLSNLQEAVKSSKLSERSPEAMREFIVSQDDSDIYIDGEQALTLYQSLDDDQKDEIERVMPDLPRKLAEASATSTDVMIKTADYLAHVAPYADMSDFAKIHPDDLTVAQSSNFEADLQEAEKLVSQEQSEADILEKRISQELVGTGQVRDTEAATVAATVRASYETMIERGMDSEAAQKVINDAFNGLSFQNQTGGDIAGSLDVFRDIDYNRPESMVDILGYRPDSLSEFVKTISEATPQEITADLRQKFRDAREGVPASRRPRNLIDYLASRRKVQVGEGKFEFRYGIKNAPQEIREIIGKDRSLQSKILNNRGGTPIDEMLQELSDEGFLNPETPWDGGVTELVEQDFSDALEAALEGQGSYVDTNRANYVEFIDQLGERLGETALDLETATDEDIQKALEGIASNEAEAIRIAAEAGYVDPDISPEEFRNLIVRDAAGQRIYDRQTQGQIDAYNRSLEEITRFQPAAPTDSREFKSWFGESKAVDGDGKPLVVYHGTEADFSSFVINDRAPAAWFSNDSSFAQSFGGKVGSYYVRLENPYIIENSGLHHEFLNDPAEITQLRADGYDGVIIRQDAIENFAVFEPDQIKSVDNRGAFDDSDPRILFQENEPDLYVAHNLSADNVLHVDKMGGLPVPSIAIARNNVDSFDNFGDITLIGDTGLIDPKGGAENKVFAADVYSPRYPSVMLDVNTGQWNDFIASIRDDVKRFGFTYPDANSFESDGYRYLEGNDAIRYEFLKSQGKAPAVKYKKPAYPDYLVKFKEKSSDFFTIADDAEFIAAAEKYYREKFDGEIRKTLLDEDGSLSFRVLRGLANDILSQPAKGEKLVDEMALRDAVRKKLQTGKTQEQFKSWLRDTFEPMVDREKIFNGFTPSGNRKYLNHDLDTVVKLLKKELRSGEGFNYGVGSVRAAYTKQFKSIADIQKSRDKIVSDEQFEKIKEEIDSEFMALGEELRQYYKFEGNSFGYMDDFSEIMKEAATKGLPRALSEGYENVPADVVEKTAGFLKKLADFPTEYFEAKIQRAVSLNEFKGAVVPKGTSKEAIDVLKKSGLKIVKYDPAKDGARQEAIGKFSKLFFQGNRGQIQLFPDGRSIITLFSKADRSTAMHELGHFYLNRILKPLSELENAPEQIKKDMATVYEFLGTEGEITREQDEKFARAFEQYLREGNAPSRGLQGIFRTFRKWLVKVYARAVNLNVEINDDIREVFNRILATDTEIAELTKDNSYAPDPAIAETLDKVSLERYERMTKNAIDEAKEVLLKKALRQKAREDAEWYKAERDRIRRDVEEALETSALYSALDYLQEGKTAGGEKVKVERLSRESVERIIGSDAAKKMPTKTMVKSGGIEPEQLADAYGFNSAQAMLTAMVNAETKKQRIERLTDDRMIAEFGDMLVDGSLDREALDAVHNPSRIKVLEYEMQKVAELAQVPATTAKQASVLAREMMMRKTVDEAIKPHGYYQATIRAARAFGKAMGQKDYAEAAVQKRKQLLNNALYREARVTRAFIENSHKRFRKLDRKDTVMAKSRDMDIVNLARAAVTRFGLGEYAIDAQALILEMQQNDPEIIRDFDSELLGQVMTMPVKNWRDLTVQDYEMLTDSVDNLYHSARERRLIKIGEEKKNIDDIVSQVIANIDENFTGDRREKLQREGWFDDVTANFKNYWVSQKKISFIAREIDGGKDGGPLWNAIIRVLNEAEGERGSRMRDIVKDMKDILTRNYTKAERFRFRGMGSDRIIVPEYDIDISKEMAISVLLNWGNEINRNRVMATPEFSTPQKVEAIFAKLDKRDFDFAQEIWDYIDKFWPEIAAVEKRTLGYTPEKQPPASIETPYGIYRGGYYPIRYNTEKSARAESIEDAQIINDMNKAAYAAAQTRRGHTKMRQATVRNLFLDYSLDTLFTHIDNVTFDITHREAVNQVNKFIRNERFQNKIYETYGSETYQAIRDWIESVATRDRHKQDATARFFGSLRAGAAIAYLGANVMTAVAQISGFVQSIPRVGYKNMAKGIMDTYSANPVAMAREFEKIMELSPVMRNRFDTFNREAAEVRNKLALQQEIRDGSTKFSFYLLSRVQMMVDMPVWKAGYIKAIEEGHSEADAIAIADQTVKDTQTSGSVVDLARAQRGTEFKKVFSLFYSYYNAKFNMAAEVTNRVKGVEDVPRLAADYFLLFMAEGIIFSLIKGYMPDDDESVAEWAALIGLNEVMGIFYGLREAAGAVNGYYDYGGPAGLSFFRTVGSTARQVKQGEVDEGLLRSSSDVISMLTKMPVRSAFNAANGVYKYGAGETDDPLVALGRREQK